MSRILNDKDRADLMAKYKDDRLKDAPHNITDKTLIENYGNDAQKALLQKAGGGVAPAKQEPKAKENKTSNTKPASGAGDSGAIEGESEAEKAENKKAFEVAEYERLHGEKPAENLPADEIRAANLTKAKELEAEAAKGSGDKTAYLDAFNQYVKLHDGKAPAKELKTEQLVEANNKRIEELKNVQAAPKGKAQTPAQKAPAKVEANNTVKGVEMVELYNTKTNETKTFARFTWENYMKGKEKDWQLKPTEPEEVQGL
jgi:hypothetical protein